MYCDGSKISDPNIITVFNRNDIVDFCVVDHDVLVLVNEGIIFRKDGSKVVLNAEHAHRRAVISLTYIRPYYLVSIFYALQKTNVLLLYSEELEWVNKLTLYKEGRSDADKKNIIII